MKLFIGNSLYGAALRCVMYYFIEILYLMLTVTSLSLETDQILRLNLRFNKTLKYTQKPRSQPQYEESLDSDKIALIALKRDLTGPVTSRSQNYDPSLWYSVKSLGSAAALSLSSDELSSSESKEESPSVERPEITIKTTARTTHRTHNVLYRLTKFSDFQTMIYERGTTRKKKTKHRDSRHDKQKKKRAGRQRNQSHSKITTVTKRIRKKKHSKKHEDPNIIGLFIDNVRQIFYNKTHYSPYSKPLHGIYDINYLWSKQKDVKKFDETLKLPLPSLKRQTEVSLIQGHKRNKNNKYKEYHIDTSLNNIVTSKHKKIQSEEKNNGPIGTNYTNKTLVESDDEMDLTFRQKLLDGVKYANINLNDLLSHYLNKPELARLQAAAKIGLDKLTDFTISFPIQWIDTVQNMSQTAVDIKKPIGWIEAIKDDAKEKISKSIVDTAKEELGKKIIETAKEEVGKKIVVTSKEEHGKKIIEAAKDEVDKKNTDTAIEEFGKQIIDTVKQGLGQNITKVQPQLMKKLTNKTRNVGNMLNKTYNLWQPWIHRVRDDVKVNSFIQHILKQYLNLFHDIENKRRDNGWKTYIRSLARNYEDKFNEYIEDIAQHKIKSKMGTKRVILNSISISNRIVIRLFNFVIDELVKKGLSENSEVSNVIAKKINEETASVLKRACSKLGVCKNRNSFISYLSNVLTTFSGLDSDQFNRAFRAITAAFKSTYFTSLGEENNQHFRDKIVKFENSHQLIKRAVVGIIKNIVTNRNTPLVVYGDSQVSTVDNTVALLEIMDTLNEKVPENDENGKEWRTIKNDLNNYAENLAPEIQNTISALVENLKKVLDGIDEETMGEIRYNAKILFT